MPTQENKHAPGYKNYQQEIELNGSMVWADPEFVFLLRAMNEAGLITRSHCCGHGQTPPWVVIRLDNIIDMQIRMDGKDYNEILLQWAPSSQVQLKDSSYNKKLSGTHKRGVPPAMKGKKQRWTGGPACPECGECKNAVLESRRTSDGGIKRRRVCVCGNRFKTYERVTL